MALSPQGYNFGKEPVSTNPFWDLDVIGDTVFKATASIHDGEQPHVDVETTKDPDTKDVNLDFSFYGIKGEKGENGKTPNIITTATTTELGLSQPQVIITEEAREDDVILNFNFLNIKGEKGEKGERGPEGTVNFEEMSPEQKEQLRGPKGDTGEPGITPTITAEATVSQEGDVAAVNVVKSGDAENPNFAFNFTGIKGTKGDKGNDGVDGTDGVTPNITVDATINDASGTPIVTVEKTGTLTNPDFTFNFLNLKGERGEQGERGIDGIQGVNGKDATLSGEYIELDNAFKLSATLESGNITDEIATGENLNGSIIYKKTFVVTSGTSIKTENQIAEVKNTLNIDKVISIDGVYETGGFVPVNFNMTGRASASIYINQGGYLIDYHDSGGYNNLPIIVNIKYTKRA